MPYDFRLPDIGEGVAEGEILKWLVKEGDKIAEDQPLVEVMTDKVNVQIPSPRGGKIVKIHAGEGDAVKVGDVIVSIETDGGDGGAQDEDDRSAAPRKQEEVRPSGQTPPMPSVGPSSTRVETQPQPRQPRPEATSVLATPATRKLARELAVDIGTVRGTGALGRITEDDVRGAAGKPVGGGRSGLEKVAGTGSEERVPVRGLRRAVAEKMSKSSQTAAHVTNVDEVDMTDLVLLREAFKASAEKRNVKLTFLPFVIKAMIPALKEFPHVNSSFDDEKGEIVLKRYYNLGVATDTENGLMVPVVKDVDKKDIFQIAAELQQLSTKARDGSISLEEVHGSTFTITNPGSIGGLFATPIINYPEVAILGMHKISKRPMVKDGRVEIRDMMYLSMTFDHRVFDGAYATRFMNRVIETMQDTKLLLSEIL